jgi:dienelactone hydrolase
MPDSVRFGGDGTGPGGWLTRTPGLGPQPAVVLVPAIAGVNDYVRRQSARLAADGYHVLALDYYARQDGRVPDLSSPPKIMEAVAALSDPQVLDDITAAAGWLREQEFVRADRVACVGFCIGGTYALMAASRVPGLACCVSFYGMLRYQQLSENKPVSPLDTAEKIACPLLGHFGEADALVPATDARELSERVKGKPAEIHLYPGAGHAFHEDFRPQVYRPVAAATAWERTGHYLRYYLRDVP